MDWQENSFFRFDMEHDFLVLAEKSNYNFGEKAKFLVLAKKN